MEIKKFQKFLTQKRWLILIIIFFVTLIFHSLIIFNTIRDDKPFVKYPVLAEKFIQGDLHKERLMDVSPLYFYLHVLARKMSVNPILLIQWLQLFLTAFSAVFFFLILKKYFTYPITLFGICLFILSNSVINHTNIMEPEILLLFFILGFIHFGSKGEEKNKLICGIFFALSLLTRPILFPFIVLVPLFFVLNRSQHRNLKTSIILFLIPTVLALSFLWIRNTIITGSFTPYVMNPGYILFEGNNPNSIGQSAIYPTLVDELANKGTPEPDKHHVVYRMIARRTSDKDLSIQEVNNFWSRKVKNFIMDQKLM